MERGLDRRVAATSVGDDDDDEDPPVTHPGVLLAVPVAEDVHAIPY